MVYAGINTVDVVGSLSFKGTGGGDNSIGDYDWYRGTGIKGNKRKGYFKKTLLC